MRYAIENVVCWELGLLCLLLMSSWSRQLNVTEEHVCGFPGAPANGGISPDKEEFGLHENISYFCKEGFAVDGSIRNQCNRDGTWENPLPVCRPDLTYSSPSESFVSDPELADRSDDTCVTVINESYEIRLKKPLKISKLAILAKIESPTLPVKYDMTIHIRENSGSDSGCEPISHLNGIYYTTLYQSVSCGGYMRRIIESQAVVITDGRLRLNNHHNLKLCAVHIFNMTEFGGCGKPDVHFGCMLTTKSLEFTSYKPKEGYDFSSISTYERRCTDGKWVGSAPICVKKTKLREVEKKNAAFETSVLNRLLLYGAISCGIVIPILIGVNMALGIYNQRRLLAPLHRVQVLKCDDPPEKRNSPLKKDIPMTEI